MQAVTLWVTQLHSRGPDFRARGHRYDSQLCGTKDINMWY